MVEYDESLEEMMMFCDEEHCEGEIMIHGSWKDCIYEAKQRGWKILHKNEEFTHSCPRHRVDFSD